ncbi:hypothetical protein OG223_30440 [Streptomyces sp. NBC_01478]|uniref:hypothetical protein n=1 Tax=Streptomyces sp. NBC_01478 TaxID=2903882 RepID=UPI002E327F32|nr:hypothetical protein [Streptomyces sp. NBC_01478]
MRSLFATGRLCLTAAVGAALIAMPTPAASASVTTTTTTAAAPPSACKTVKNYSKYKRRWMKAEACLKVQDGKPAMYFWGECQIQDKSTAYSWHYETCVVKAIYTLSKDGKELTNGSFTYDSITDGVHDAYKAYDCQGTGTYTLHAEQNSYGNNAFGEDDPAYTEVSVSATGC